MSTPGLRGTFSTGRTAQVGQTSEAFPIPSGIATVALFTVGVSASNSIKTQKRTSPGGTWVDQATYTTEQSATEIPVVPGEEWRIVTVAQQPITDIKYVMRLSTYIPLPGGPATPAPMGVPDGLIPRNDFELQMPVVSQQRRNSENASTDTTPMVLGTVVIPPGELQPGSSVVISALFENTSSASTKTFRVQVNGTTVGQTNQTSTNQPFLIDFKLFVEDANTLRWMNSLGAAAGSAGGGGTSSLQVIDIPENGLTVTFLGYWGAAVASEYITCMVGKTETRGRK